ncbi:hypothetical protein BH23ACT10_BH23ACT10_31130 [soil metagenome]
MSPSDVAGTAAWCESVHQIYRTVSGEVHALRGIDVTIFGGRLTAVVGPSGSGKSSLLWILAGLDIPTAGTVVIGGVAVGGLAGRELRRVRRRHLGFVFQRPSHNLIAQLTARQHLEHAYHVRAIDTDAQTDGLDSDELLELLGLGDRGRHRPHELSGGEQQRLAFAQAVAGGPTMVVADEPTAELDSHSAEELLRLAARLARLGSAIVVSSHDLRVAAAADVIIELRDGALQGERARRRRGSGRDTCRHRYRRPGAAARASAGAVPRPPRACARWRRRRVAGPAMRALAGDVVVRLDRCTKTYRRGSETVQALVEVSVDIVAGELVAVAGPSGSGKTTLLNILVGWEQPDSGRVLWSTPPERGADPPWSRLGIVPQRLGLIAELTVLENICLPLRLAADATGADERAQALVDDLHLGFLGDRLPAQVSLGEQQRTAIARALVLHPSIVVLDEPTAHQDEASTNAVATVLRRAALGGTSCVIATHAPDLLSATDRSVQLVDGHMA